MKHKGFTLIELLVVISIIGLLSSVVLASLNTGRAKARDAKRKSDLHQIALALGLYYDKFGTCAVAGGGWQGGGEGWVGQENDGGDYVKSVTRILNEQGFYGAVRTDDPIQNPGYMIYVCGDQFALSATLENPSAADIAYIQTTCNGIGINGTYPKYGKNYAITN